MTPANSAALRPGAAGAYRIGRYRIRARLGKGGMGVVYLGRDEALDRDVAVKTLRVDGAADDESRGRFEIEARAAARLQHPNIVTVFELGEDRGLPYIAMELLGGQDLETLLRANEKLSITERLEIVIQTLRGLDFAHGHHIVHRDIKPSNLRVLDDGGVKILDFGIAKVESTSVTRAGMMVGTPYYMSPEHIRGGVLDGRSDVFAVGVILHELFAKKRPFNAEDAARVMYRIVNEPHARLEDSMAGRLTPDVQRVIDKALEKDADARYGSASLMADDLQRVRERYPSPHLRSDDAMAISRAKKSLSASRTDATVIESVEAIAAANPEVNEASRLLRALRRKPLESVAAAETAAFPELDATFARAASHEEETLVSGRTVSGRAETLMQGDVKVAPTPTPKPASSALVYGAVAVTVVMGGIAAFLYFKQAGISEVTRKPPATARASRSKNLAPMAEGLPGAAPEAPTVSANLAASGNSAAIGKPVKPGSPETAAAQVPSQRRSQPSGPPGTLVIESAYPVTFSASGRVIATDKLRATAILSSGTQDVLIESAAVFLRHRETVRVAAGGTVTIRTPETGKIGVRANPDNCKVFVDGIFVDYPPIRDRDIAAGSHVLSFEWPDGARSEQKIQIQAGKPSYVMGRKP